MEDLRIRLLQFDAGLLVLDGKVPLVPDIGPTVAAGLFGSAGLKGEELAFGIKLNRLAVTDQFAQVKEVLLVCATLGHLGNGAPLIDEFLWDHAGFSLQRWGYGLVPATSL